MSANEYMKTATGFAASLLQSLGGDTEKAAQYADKAVVQMADNANKMGTDIESIKTAYQGFSKQNYTMLDNLKLGYGGTKQEMERLIKDAEGLDKSFKASRDSNGNLTMSYADIVDAIQIVQDEMGITGTTAEEASNTISGSIASMKAAWENFTTGLADENANVEELTQNLINSVGVVAGNLMPVIGQVLKTIGKMILNGIGSAFQSGYEALDSWLNSLGTSVQSWLDAKLAEFLGWASELKGSAQAAWNDFVSWLSGVADQVVAPIRNAVGKIRGVGKNLIEGLWNGISDMVGWIYGKISGFASGVLSKIKGVFGIHSPSRVMRDVIGKNLALGIGVGFENTMPDVLDDMKGALDINPLASSVEVSASGGGSRGSNGGVGGNIINIYPQNLTEAQIDYLFTRFNAKMGAMA